MKIYSHKDLNVWKKGKDIVREIYGATSLFPKDELYGLVSQMRRAAVSIPANIAEGHGRNSSKEYLHHLSIAYGSLCELETLVIVAEELHLLTKDTQDNLLELLNEEARMLNGLQQKISEKITPDLKPLTSDLMEPAA